MKYKNTIVILLAIQSIFLAISFLTTSTAIYIINFLLNFVCIILAIISLIIKEK